MGGKSARSNKPPGVPSFSRYPLSALRAPQVSLARGKFDVFAKKFSFFEVRPLSNFRPNNFARKMLYYEISLVPHRT